VFSLDSGFAYAAMHTDAAKQLCPEWLGVFSSVISKVKRVGAGAVSGIKSPSVSARRSKKREPHSSRKFRWIIIVTGIGASLSFCAQIVASAKLGIRWQFGITSFGMLCTALAVVLPLIQQRANEQTLLDVEEATKAGRLEAYVRTQDSLTSSVSDVLSAIASEQSSEGLRESKSKLKRAIVELAAQAGPNRTRACYFDYDPGPPRSLECRACWTGRSTPPTRYTEETKVGRAALTMVSRRGSSFRPDLDEDPLLSDKEYKTYIAVTVANELRIFGMLTIDALQSGDLQ